MGVGLVCFGGRLDGFTDGGSKDLFLSLYHDSWLMTLSENVCILVLIIMYTKRMSWQACWKKEGKVLRALFLIFSLKFKAGEYNRKRGFNFFHLLYILHYEIWLPVQNKGKLVKDQRFLNGEEKTSFLGTTR